MSIDVHTRTPPAPVVDMAAGVWTRRGTAVEMPSQHRHDDLELNFVLRGSLDYLFGGTRMSVHAGQIALFWGATAHGLVGPPSDEQDVCWVHIPLSTVLGWGLPTQDLHDVLLSRPVIVPASAAGREVESMFMCWVDEIEDDQNATIALLEAQALVRRVLNYQREVVDAQLLEFAKPGELTAKDSMLRVTAMAQFIVSRFREPITTADITEISHLNPNYAMTLFREAVGATIGDYLTRCRVSEAQRLLLTTSMRASDIAHAAGFGSQSSFYAHFLRVCGVSPAQYRALNS